MLRVTKPKNARSKRALDKREAKESENVKKAIFVRGNKISQKVQTALTQLSALKKPDAISFSKKNDVNPFEPQGQQSLEFWSGKNDASLFLVGDDKKKRKDNLIWCRLFDGKLLDLIEMGIENAIPMTDFKGPKPGLGLRPLFHFSGPQFQTDTTLLDPTLPSTPHQHLKSILLDFYHGEELPTAPSTIAGEGQIALNGLQHVISVTAAPLTESSSTSSTLPSDLAALYSEASKIDEGTTSTGIDLSGNGQLIYFRVYTIQLLASGNKTPRVELIECGPSFDFILRRRKPAPIDLLSQAMKRPKTKEEKLTQGKGKRKNVDTDEMGDMVGRIHLGKQDLKSIQNRKMKGLKGGEVSDDDDDEGVEGSEDEGDFEGDGDSEELEFEGDDDDNEELEGGEGESLDGEVEDQEDLEVEKEEEEQKPKKKVKFDGGAAKKLRK